jgi:hypothetical protein
VLFIAQIEKLPEKYEIHGYCIGEKPLNGVMVLLFIENNINQKKLL